LVFGLYLFVLLGFFTFSWAQEPKPLEVIGTHKSIGGIKSDLTGFSETIKAEEFRGRYTNLTDILEREAGLKIRRFGGLGSYSTLSIRGSNANQVRIYVDGIPLNNSQGGEVNLSDLGFDQLDKIEIHKSGLASGFSHSAIGGTVNLLTNQTEPKKVSRVSVGAGSFQTFKLNGFYSNFTEKSRYSVFVQKEKSDQNFIFKSDNGTPVFYTYDDKDTRRKNAQFDRYNFTTKFSYDLSESTTLHLLNDFNTRTNGIPGPGSNQTEKVNREYYRNTTGLSTNTKSLFQENISLNTRLYYTGERDHLFDPLQEFSSGTPNSRANIQNYGFHFLPTISLLKYKQIIKILLSNERESFIRDKRNRYDEIIEKSTKKFRNHTTFQIQDEIRVFKDDFILIPVVQSEIFLDRFNETPSLPDTYSSLSSEYKLPSPSRRTEFLNSRLGAIYHFFKSSTQTLSIKGNVSKENRIPLFSEFFGERGSILGNTALRPEKSQNRDIGIVWEKKEKQYRGTSTLSLFEKRIQDMILFIPNSQFSLRPENVDSATITGLEWSSKLQFLENWKLISNYTYQRAINTSDISYLNGKYLPLRPMHEWFGSLSYRFHKLEVGGEINFIGASFRDRTNEYVNYQEARWIYNGFFQYTAIKDTQLNRELMIGLDIRNLLDYRTYDIIGYPLPGRNFYLTLSGVF
jgi:iron complex outermembrane recepter protein